MSVVAFIGEISKTELCREGRLSASSYLEARDIESSSAANAGNAQ